MTRPDPRPHPDVFDAFAPEYDRALDEGLSVSGENRAYFATQRVRWLAGMMRRMNVRCRNVLDFGCGTGAATPQLLNLPGAERVLGVDTSARSIEIAQASHARDNVRFAVGGCAAPENEFDLVFCNGVFHHIRPPARPDAIATIRRALRPGGWIALWENNPWNPGTRYVMSRIPFDRDAVPLSSRQTRRLVQNGGLLHVRTDFLFIFPRALRWLRPIERRMTRLPAGAQYQVLCRKPDAAIGGTLG